MRCIKRTAISLKPRQAHVDWANGLDEDGVKTGTEFIPEENVYLVDDSVHQPDDLETFLEPYYTTIVEEELAAWHGIEADWPQRRDLTIFLAWFEVEVHSLVLQWVRRLATQRALRPLLAEGLRRRGADSRGEGRSGWETRQLRRRSIS